MTASAELVSAPFVTTFARLAPIVGELFDRKPLALSLETHLGDDLKADSLDTWELLIVVEETFGIVVPDESFDHVHTLGDVVALIVNFTTQGGVDHATSQTR